MGRTSRPTSRRAVQSRPAITADDVIDAAERLVDDDGLDSLSVRRLAERLDVSRQVVYTHFDGMHGVLDALHRRFGVALTERVRTLSSSAGSDDRMVEAAHAYVTIARQRPGLFELTFGHPVATYTASPATTDQLRAVFGEHVVGLVREWSATDDADAIDALTAARVFWSCVHGLVTLERAGHATADETDALVERTIRSLLAGWRDHGVAPVPPTRRR